MGTGVFFNLPIHGHINPALPVVAELVKRGERILYFSTEEFRGKIESAGAEFVSYDFAMSKDPENVRAGGNFIRLAKLLLGGCGKRNPPLHRLHRPTETR